MRSLDSFKGYREVFTEARALPAFFQTNLVDPARVVKVFQNDPQAEIRIFYYQYLKLCFQLDNVNYDLYIRKVEEIINNPTFQFIFAATADPSVFNDTQAKSLIMEFFGVLSEGQSNVIDALRKYPIMDTILVHFFRSLMILSRVTDSLDCYLQRDLLLDFLCKTFEVEAEIHGECIRYIETDIFIYEESREMVYMAYMDYEAQNQQVESSPQVNQSLQQGTYAEPAPAVNGFAALQNQVASQPESKRQSLAKDSYVASQFLDFTSNAETLASKAKVTLKSSGMDYPVQQPVQQKIEPKVEPKIEPKVETKVEPKVVPKVEPKPSPAVVTQVPQQVNIDAKSTTSYNVNTSKVDIKSIPSNERPSEIRQDQKPSTFDNFPKLNPIQGSPNPQTAYQSQSQYTLQSNVNINNKYSSSLQQPAQQTPTLIKNSPQPQPRDTFNSPQLNSSSSYKQNNDLIYTPKVEVPNFNTNPPKYQQPTKDVKSTTTVAPSKRKPFGLNISDEFTSPEVSKYLAQPHRSNVQAMKTRQRNFRSSLSAMLK